jgi:hypothetical protein
VPLYNKLPSQFGSFHYNKRHILFAMTTFQLSHFPHKALSGRTDMFSLAEESSHTHCTVASVEDYEEPESTKTNGDKAKRAPIRSQTKMVPRRSILKMDSGVSERRTGSMPDIASMSIASTVSSTSSASRRRRSVEFGSIEIRQHGLVLGDHPDCSYGPPVQLGWECQEKTLQNVDDYEFSRRPRRHRSNLAINYYTRKDLLMNGLGMSEQEVKAATRQVSKDKMRRALTRTFLPLHRVEDVVESSRRKVRRAAGKQETKLKTVEVEIKHKSSRRRESS